MNRNAKVAAVTAVIGVALLGVGWLTLKPGWQTASRKEVNRVIDPLLLQGDSPDPAAMERGRRFAELMAELKLPQRPSGKPSRQEATKIALKFRAANQRVIPNVRALLDQGPIQLPERGFLEVDKAGLRPVTMFSRGLALICSEPSLPMDERVAAVEVGEKFAFRCLETSRSILLTIAALAGLATIERPARELARSGRLSPSQRQRLSAALVQVDKSTDLKQPIVGEFRSQIYKLLPDPSALLRDPSFNFGNADKENDLPGRYDAIDTARIGSAMSLELIRNADLRPSKISTPIQDHVRDVANSIPVEDYLGRKGLSRWWGREYYRYRLARIPNSFGHILLMVTSEDIKKHVEFRASVLAWHRVLETQVACQRYIQARRQAPQTLDDLVSSRLLSAVPQDPYDLQPLGYDPKRRLIWSVGINEIDDHGASTPLVNREPPDIAMHFAGASKP